MASDDWTNHPNEDIARAIDTLAAQLPASITADLLVLSCDTVRVALSQLDRCIDITRRPSATHCDVTVYSFTSSAATDLDMTHHHDVALEHLAGLLAQPLPGRRNLLFGPVPTR